MDRGVRRVVLLNLVLYVNFVKNVGDWVSKHGNFQNVPSFMRIPLIDNFTINLHNVCGHDLIPSHPGVWACPRLRSQPLDRHHQPQRVGLVLPFFGVCCR